MWRRIEEVFRNHPARVIALVAAAYVLALVLGAGFALLQSGRAGDELLITPQVTDTLPSRATRDAVDTRPTSMPPPGETLPPPPGTNPPAATAQPPATTPVPSPTQFAGTPPRFTNTPTAPAGTVTFPTPPPPTATGTPTPTARPGETVVPPTSTTGSTPYPPDATATSLTKGRAVLTLPSR